MKKLYLISILLILVCAANAQTTFTVPTPTMDQKYNVTKDLLYNNILSLLAVAKSEGLTAEKLGTEIGYRIRWGEDAGFEQFVNFTLFSWACFSDSVKILEQSSEKVVISVPHIYPTLEDQRVLYGTSIINLIAYFDAMMGEIARPLGIRNEITWGEEGMKIEIAQLQ